jgi:DNA-binding response OmpR family regulator
MEKRILIADDEQDWVRMLAMRLGHEGYQTEAAFDAVQTIGQAIQAKPDLILLDIMMPGGGGLVALKNMKASAKVFPVPVIVVSAKGDDETREAAEKLGVSGYFIKPVDMTALVARIRTVLCA